MDRQGFCPIQTISPYFIIKDGSLLLIIPIINFLHNYRLKTILVPLKRSEVSSVQIYRIKPRFQMINMHNYIEILFFASILYFSSSHTAVDFFKIMHIFKLSKFGRWNMQNYLEILFFGIDTIFFSIKHCL